MGGWGVGVEGGGGEFEGVYGGAFESDGEEWGGGECEVSWVDGEKVAWVSFVFSSILYLCRCIFTRVKTRPNSISRWYGYAFFSSLFSLFNSEVCIAEILDIVHMMKVL